MFKWLRRIDPEASGVGEMDRKFGRMIDDGRHIFDAASSAFLEGADASVIHKDLVATDRGINALEREIRRGIVVHATVHGASEVPTCLVLMSLTKDAERIGDYAKNILDLALVRPKKPGSHFFDHMLELKNKISAALADTREIYDAQDADRASAFIDYAGTLKTECETNIQLVLNTDEQRNINPADLAATVLCYRYFKRVISHARNIVTSLVVSVDRLDYFDESDDTRLPAE